MNIMITALSVVLYLAIGFFVARYCFADGIREDEPAESDVQIKGGDIVLFVFFVVVWPINAVVALSAYIVSPISKRFDQWYDRRNGVWLTIKRRRK